jgi:hypothetical protein
METNKPEQKNNRGTLWIILFLISAVVNVYQFMHQSKTNTIYEQRVDTLIVERVNVEKELADTKSELEKYRGISANLDSLLNEAQGKIDEQAKKLKDMSARERNMTELNKKLKQQLADLQVLRDEYLGRIDSLLIANKQLVNENQQKSSKIENLSKNLETTVATASVLKTEYLKVKSYKRKSSGKYVETALAKRTHKLDVCFDVLDNKIAKAGDRTVYLKITEPGGKAVGNRSTGSSTFKTSTGEEVMFAASTTMNYTGAKQNICMSYEEQEDKMFPAGTYMFEVYIDGVLSGAGTYDLK